MAILLNKKREFFWDSYLVDEEKTTAVPRLMHPELKGTCLFLDQGDEVCTTISFPNIVKDNKGYKMYYSVWQGKPTYLAVMESNDGINWTKPHLDIFPHPELKDNNVVLDNADTLFVFYDENPDCPADEKYKAVGPRNYNHEENSDKTAVELWCWYSPDGYHFRRSHCIETDGHFDSLNTAIWRDGQYSCYYRHFHDENGEDWTGDWDNFKIRDVRVIHSKDFKTWTKQKRIQFADNKDYPIYTNNVFVYPRESHMLLGFPTRYFERKEWTENTAQLKSAKLKKELIDNDEVREGLALTDCIFMFSRDGEHWNRFNQAFMASEYEDEDNWIYGDCYPGYSIIDSGKETYYMYTIDRHRSFGKPKPLNLYEIRKDGFACYEAGENEEVIVTKPLIFEGKDLHLNFLTSAYGYIYVDVLDEDGNKISDKESFEIYGNTIDRKIAFSDGSDFSEYAGKPIRLRFRMRDSKLFSMIFE